MLFDLKLVTAGSKIISWLVFGNFNFSFKKVDSSST